MEVSIRDYFRLRLYDVLTTGGLSVRQRVDEYVGGLERDGVFGGIHLDVSSLPHEFSGKDVMDAWKGSGDFLFNSDDRKWENIFYEIGVLVNENPITCKITGDDIQTLSLMWEDEVLHVFEFSGRVDWREVVSYVINYFLVQKRMYSGLGRDGFFSGIHLDVSSLPL